MSHKARRFLLIVSLLISLPVLWSVLTTPTLLGKTVRIEFSWNEDRGFDTIRTVDGLGRVLDPPYDHYFTNPIVTMQAKPRIVSLIKAGELGNGSANYQTVNGRLYVYVVCLGIVRGFGSATREGWTIEAH